MMHLYIPRFLKKRLWTLCLDLMTNLPEQWDSWHCNSEGDAAFRGEGLNAMDCQLKQEMSPSKAWWSVSRPVTTVRRHRGLKITEFLKFRLQEGGQVDRRWRAAQICCTAQYVCFNIGVFSAPYNYNGLDEGALGLARDSMKLSCALRCNGLL